MYLFRKDTNNSFPFWSIYEKRSQYQIEIQMGPAFLIFFSSGCI